ncbi:MAG: hypothetical protein IKV87_02350 [Methanobrevibacter sp.]|nr:hypothetical protein [Methanobrevibacter sp.]
MYDLSKLEEKFHEFLTDGLKEGDYDKSKLPKLNEDLFEEMGELRWTYYFRYYLALEDGKPVLYVRAYSTVHDMDEAFVVTETSYYWDKERKYFKNAKGHLRR